MTDYSAKIPRRHLSNGRDVRAGRHGDVNINIRNCDNERLINYNDLFCEHITSSLIKFDSFITANACFTYVFYLCTGASPSLDLIKCS